MVLSLRRLGSLSLHINLARHPQDRLNALNNPVPETAGGAGSPVECSMRITPRDAEAVQLDRLSKERALTSCY